MILPIKNDNPTITRPWVTLSIVAINSIVFLYSYLLGTHGFDVFTQRMGLIPFEITHAVDAVSPTPIPLYLTIFSAMFMHGGLMHLGGNLLYLWIFGNNVVDSMGHGMFVVFYLLCGSLAALVQVFSDPTSNIPMVGASGAVAGTLGAYLLLHPRARILTFVFLGIFWTFIRLPALVVLLGWIALQIFNALGTQPGTGGVAWLAHVGGFFSGAILIGLFKYRSVSFFNASRKGPWGRN